MFPFRVSGRIRGRIPGEASWGQTEAIQHHQPTQLRVSQWPDDYIEEHSFRVHWGTNEAVPAREFQTEREIHECEGAVQPCKNSRYVLRFTENVTKEFFPKNKQKTSPKIMMSLECAPEQMKMNWRTTLNWPRVHR
jgi:hypothetical protein